jgi:hypothetical protein
MLYIGTSTQYQLTFVNVNTSSQPTESNQVEDEATNSLVIIRNSDGSIIVRATGQVTNKKRVSSPKTNKFSV